MILQAGGVSIPTNDLGKGVLPSDSKLGVGPTILWGGFRTEDFPLLNRGDGEFEFNSEGIRLRDSLTVTKYFTDPSLCYT